MNTYERIKTLCEREGFSVSSICQHIPGLSINRSSITGWKNGAKPRPAVVKAIAEYFNVSIDFLLCKTDDPNESSVPTRNIEKESVKVPVFAQVAAGLPLFMSEDIVDYEEIPKAWLAKGEYFGLTIKGNSMEPRICDGDVVIVRKQPTCENGQVAIVAINGDEATCKKVSFHANGITLIPFNQAYEPMFFTSDEVKNLPITIYGVVVELRGKF
ncbi:MAG: LexA family protein [Christensenellales bacterium]